MIWLFPFMRAVHYTRDIRKYGIKDPKVLSSLFYWFGCVLGYYDYFIYSKMSGGLDLLTSNWVVWRIFFILFLSVSVFLSLDYIDPIKSWIKEVRGKKE